MYTFKNITEIKEFEKIPLNERNLPKSTYEAIRLASSKNLHASALSFFTDAQRFQKSAKFSYQELLQKIHQAANLFSKCGITSNEVVSILLPNAPEAHFAFWGAEAVGIANPINPLLEIDQIVDIMRAAKSKILVTLAPLPGTDIWAKVDIVRQKVPTLETIFQVDLAEYLPVTQSCLVRGLVSVKRLFTNQNQRIVSFRAEMNRVGFEKLEFERDIKPDDIAAYFHTGGTTGSPKLAMHTHANEVFNAWATSQYCGVDSHHVFLCALPLFHVNGVFVTGLMPWMTGASVVLATPQGYRANGIFTQFWKIVEHFGITAFSAVPTVYSALLNIPIGESDISSLEFAITGAAALPSQIRLEFEARTNLKILEGYGLTEGTCVSTANPPNGDRRSGSIGLRIPYQKMMCALFDKNKNYLRNCLQDEIGEILISGPNVFPGYLEDIQNLKMVVSIPGQTQNPWLRTGDLGRQDTDGYFWLTGRKKELIIRGGHNIDPRIIEDSIGKHDAVLMTAAVGRPDARVGEIPIAYVVLKPGQSVSVETLLSFASEQITEKAAIPKFLYIVDSLPLTAVGKIFKPMLVGRQIVDVIITELATIPDFPKFSVTIAANPLHGTIATIIVDESDLKYQNLEEKIKIRLGKFSIPYEISIK